MTDVVGPRRSVERHVLPAGEGRRSQLVHGRPGALQAVRDPGAEVAPPLRALVEGFDQGQVLVRALDLVHVAGLEDPPCFGILQHHDRIAEAVGELRDRRLALVPTALVVREEQVAEFVIADDPEVEPSSVLFDDRRRPGEQGRWRGPPRGIPRVVRGREHGRPRLEHEIPGLLRGEVEQLGRGDVRVEAAGLVHMVEGRLGSLAPVFERHIDQPVDPAARHRARIHVPAVLVANDRGIFDGHQIVLGVGSGHDDGPRRCPGDVRRQARRCRRR